MPHALINGVRIYYETYGHGKPLVLAYGLGGNTTEWAPQIPAFSKKYRLILWDPRGHGQSDSPSSPHHYGNGESSYDLLALLGHLEIPKAHVGGLSMGASIASRFALLHPERCYSLLIFDSHSASGLPNTDAMIRMRERIIEIALTKGMDAVAEYSIKQNPNIKHTADTGGPQAVENIRQMYRSLSPVGYAYSTRSTIYATFDSDILKGIKVPTLVLAGKEDSALEACRLVHSKIAGSRLVEIPDAGHLSNLDQPEAFTKAILDFLGAVDSGKKHKTIP